MAATSLALAADGAVWGWGAHSSGAFGTTADSAERGARERQRSDSLGAACSALLGLAARVACIACGNCNYGFCVLITCDGATYSFGTESTDNTVLGHGDIMVPGEVVARPRRIEALRGVHACGVSVGEHCLLYDAAGRLYSWGRAELCGLGPKDESESERIPQLVDSLAEHRACAVSVGGCVSLVCTRTGAIFSFGDDWRLGSYARQGGEWGEWRPPARPSYEQALGHPYDVEHTQWTDESGRSFAVHEGRWDLTPASQLSLRRRERMANTDRTWHRFAWSVLG